MSLSMSFWFGQEHKPGVKTVTKLGQRKQKHHIVNLPGHMYKEQLVSRQQYVKYLRHYLVLVLKLAVF